MRPAAAAADVLRVHGMAGDTCEVPRGKLATFGDLRKALPPQVTNSRLYEAGHEEQKSDDEPLPDGVSAFFALPCVLAYPDVQAFNFQKTNQRPPGCRDAPYYARLWSWWHPGDSSIWQRGSICVPTPVLRVINFDRCLAAKAIDARYLLFEVVPSAEGDAFVLFLHRVENVARQRGRSVANVVLQRSDRPAEPRFQVGVLNDALLRRMRDATDPMHADGLLRSARLAIYAIYRNASDTSCHLAASLGV